MLGRTGCPLVINQTSRLGLILTRSRPGDIKAGLDPGHRDGSGRNAKIKSD